MTVIQLVATVTLRNCHRYVNNAAKKKLEILVCCLDFRM